MIKLDTTALETAPNKPFERDSWDANGRGLVYCYMDHELWFLSKTEVKYIGMLPKSQFLDYLVELMTQDGQPSLDETQNLL